MGLSFPLPKDFLNDLPYERMLVVSNVPERIKRRPISNEPQEVRGIAPEGRVFAAKKAYQARHRLTEDLPMPLYQFFDQRRRTQTNHDIVITGEISNKTHCRGFLFHQGKDVLKESPAHVLDEHRSKFVVSHFICGIITYSSRNNLLPACSLNGKFPCKLYVFPLSLDTMEAAIHAIEPQFLSQALSQGSKIRIGQMNKSEHEGIIREIGRYEINIDVNGHVITLLKKDISYISTPAPLISLNDPGSLERPSPPTAGPAEHTSAKPNIQQEFLDKAIRENQVLTIFLVTGQRIRAAIDAYDNFTVLVRENGKQHLFYKHAITTINR
jgi:host factor-I protein